jgi:glycerol-3-phosphate O-acyltransferase
MKQLFPDLKDWPIYKLSEKRAELINEINEVTYNTFVSYEYNNLHEVISKTIFQEKNRVKNTPWPVDPPNEVLFWNKLQKRLAEETDTSQSEKNRLILEELLRIIINRYTQEIVGSFKISTFLFARIFLTIFFNAIFNPFRGKHAFTFWSSAELLAKKLRVVGPVKEIRSLCQDHIPVVVPTHSSNLDSILIGYMLYYNVGLPGFAYGAGLNLYNFGLAAYFMNRLGAYRVDRRKKNLIYLECLKTMSQIIISKGTNSIFFPGGTRSRSNHVEQKLKLGLLSTTIHAQRDLCESGSNKRVVIIPLVVNNHFVLEAPTLINDHMRSIGKEQYRKDRRKRSWYKRYFKYWFQFLKRDTEVVFKFGHPIDVFGNQLDIHGNSHHKSGKTVNLEDYFKVGDQIVQDDQRESEYTRILADYISQSYRTNMLVLDSQMLAYVSYQLLLKKYREQDVFNLLKYKPEELVLNRESVEEAIDHLKIVISEKNNGDAFSIDDRLHHKSGSDILESGLKNLNVFHLDKILYLDKNMIKTGNLRLLYFYHNRLDGIGLEEHTFWKELVL